MNYIIRLVWFVILITSTISGATVVAAPVITPEVKPITTTTTDLPKTLSVDLINSKIDIAATKYQVNAQLMRAVIKCESGFKTDAVGDGGNSFGLVQIHLPSHPNITKEQANDPDFAINFLADNLSKGRGNLWTCFRMLQ